jgi:hypothetical protein
MKKIYLALALFCLGINAEAQSNQSKKLEGGLELDILSYATGGYFGAGWMGKDLWRVRALTAFVKKPDWSTKSGFSNHQITAYALVVDRFLKPDWKGWWIGAGLVYWYSSIQADAKINTASFNNVLANGSLGYNFSLNKHFYCAPWASLNLKLAGDKNISVDSKIYNLPLINPEASFKFGYRF